MYIELYQLSADKFEHLIQLLCQELFGLGLSIYSDGKDEGKDGAFEGLANAFPSTSQPWDGKTIIQMKHTSNPVASMSDKSFFSEESQNTIIGKEIPKIITLIQNKQLDHYALFTNYKKTEKAERKIKEFICQKTNLKSTDVVIFGKDDIELKIKKYPGVIEKLHLSLLEIQMEIDSTEIANLIQLLNDHLNALKQNTVIILEQTENKKTILARTTFNDKVILNNMSEDYAKCIKKQIVNFTPIQNFLQNNSEYLEIYNNVIEELNPHIIAYRNNEQVFDKIIESTYDLLIKYDVDLRNQKKLLRTLLYYMFFYCDIGKNKDVDSN